jgi:hypothetical protein
MSVLSKFSDCSNIYRLAQDLMKDAEKMGIAGDIASWAGFKSPLVHWNKP